MLRHGDVEERRASLLVCEQIVGACLYNLRTMSCTIPIVPGRDAAEGAFAGIGGALTDALADVDSQVRVGAVRLILTGSEFPEPSRKRAVAELRKAMQDPDSPSRRSLVESMCREESYRNSPNSNVDLVSIFIDGVNDPDATVRLGPEAEASRSNLIDRLMDELRAPEPSWRVFVAAKLGYFAKSSKDVLRALRGAETVDPDDRVREAARQSLDFYIRH